MDKNGKPEVQLLWYTPPGSAPIDKYVVTEYVDNKKGREKVVPVGSKTKFSLYLTNLDKKKQYYYVIKSLDVKQWQVSNIVKLRTAGLEDATL
jgi:hypothetical protein